MLHGQFFGEDRLEAYTLARSLVGTLVRRIPEDVSILNKFWHARRGEAGQGGEGGMVAVPPGRQGRDGGDDVSERWYNGRQGGAYHTAMDRREQLWTTR